MFYDFSTLVTLEEMGEEPFRYIATNCRLYTRGRLIRLEELGQKFVIRLVIRL